MLAPPFGELSGNGNSGFLLSASLPRPNVPAGRNRFVFAPRFRLNHGRHPGREEFAGSKAGNDYVPGPDKVVLRFALTPSLPCTMLELARLPNGDQGCLRQGEALNASALAFISLVLAARMIIFRIISKGFVRFAPVALTAAMVQVSLVSLPSAQTQTTREALGSSLSNTVEQIEGIPRLRENPKTPLAKRRDPDSTERMIRPGFLDIELRQNLIELARDGLAAHRLARRANALVLLDDGMSCEAIAKVLLLDDDTIRTWYRLYEEDGIEGLTNFSYEGSACQLSGEQQEKLKGWVATALPRTTRQVGAWIENEFGVVYEGRSGLIALLHRLGLEYHKPNVIPRKLDEEKQKAFIEGYEKLLNSLGDDEAVLFADAVHPTHAARPVGCWAPSREKLAIEQTSGRQRINIHGAIDLETGQTRMIEALTIDAASTIRLLQSIEALYPMLALIHVFLDNARYHHAKLVQEWLALPGRRIKLHFIPTYCPHLNPIERLWGLMHRNVTHNKCYATCAQFADATLSFLREKVPGNWADLCDSVTDNFRVINPKDFRVMT